MIRNPSQKPAPPAGARTAPAPQGKAGPTTSARLDAVRVLLHGFPIGPGTFSKIEAELSAVVAEAEGCEAENERLRREVARLEARIAAATVP